MDFWGTNLCQACLSNDRKLYPTSKLQPILKELQFLQAVKIIGGICWECRRIILNMQKFKNQVLKAQNIINLNSKLAYQGNLSSVNKIDFDYKFIYSPECPDSLKYMSSRNEFCSIKEENMHNIDDKVETVCSVDDKYSNIDDKYKSIDDKTDIMYTTNDKYNNIDKYNKSEIGVPKDCISQYSKDLKDVEETIFVKVLDTGNESKVNRKRKVLKTVNKKLQSRDKEDNVLREKFTTVIFSEEDMVKHREQKRSQPNFKKIPYKCDTCVLGFTRKETYNLHYEKKHCESIGPYACPVCTVRYRSPTAVASHARRHYVHYRCTLCSYQTSRRGSALSHESAKHAGDSAGAIRCGQCAFVAGTAEDLAEHRRMKHLLSCDECSEKFKGKHTLRTHKVRIHSANREYVCDICSRTFKTKSRLESHMVTHNTALAQSLAYCGVCDVQYKNIYVYRHHLRNSVNHSERVYHCKDCNKRFASKVYYQKHCDFYHLQKSRYKCDICDKLLISEWRLKNHMQTRHGSSRVRNHACAVCEKKFFTIPTLRAHELTHSAERGYMCERCGDTFRQRAALHTHTRALHTHNTRAACLESGYV